MCTDTVTRASNRAIREISCAKRTKGMYSQSALLCVLPGNMSLTRYQVDLMPAVADPETCIAGYTGTLPRMRDAPCWTV